MISAQQMRPQTGYRSTQHAWPSCSSLLCHTHACTAAPVKPAFLPCKPYLPGPSHDSSICRAPTNLFPQTKKQHTAPDHSYILAPASCNLLLYHLQLAPSDQHSFHAQPMCPATLSSFHYTAVSDQGPVIASSTALVTSHHQPAKPSEERSILPKTNIETRKTGRKLVRPRRRATR